MQSDIEEIFFLFPLRFGPFLNNSPESWSEDPRNPLPDAVLSGRGLVPE